VSIGALARGAVQVTAGALVLVLGLGQVGAPGLRRLAGVRLAGRDRCRQGVPGGMVAAAGAGLATVLVPCGVTVVVEALAATSGSAVAGAAVAGAAVMSVFVIGTWPLFGLLGLVARRAVTAWHGRLRVFTGAAVVVAGLWTAVGGLAVAGVPGDPLRWIGGAAPPTGPGGSDRVGGDVVAVAGGRQTVTVTVRSNGFDPAEVAIHAGLPTTLVLRARHATGCIRTVVIAGRNGEWVLPADGDTRVDLGVPAHGVVRYSCVMGMYSARLTAG
jgi:hypothetical protein